MTTPPSPARVPNQLAFSLVLMWALVAATASVGFLSVLASSIIEDFSISRAEFGLLLTSVTVVGAISSPLAGRVTDVIGGRNALIVVFAFSALSLSAFSVAPLFSVMFVGSLLAAGGAAANPSTNKLIATHTAVGRRGAVTGIKQAGPQVGFFIAGVLAPWGATTIGWRPTVAIAAAVAAIGIPFVVRAVPADPARVSRGSGERSPLPHDVRWVAAYGFLLGVGGSAAFLVPLHAEEGLDLSPQTAGFAVAMIGAFAIFGRLAWARLGDRSANFYWPLGVIAVLSAFGAAAFLASVAFGSGFMWLGVVLIGLSSSSWTSVGALAVMAIVGSDQAGRASGLVWLGFLAGAGVGPPIFGWTVDRTGSYSWMWVIALAAFVSGAVLTAAWSVRSRSGS